MTKPQSGQWRATDGLLLGGRRLVVGQLDAAREDVGEACDVVAGEDVVAALVLLAQAVDELSSEDVDLAVQNATAVEISTSSSVSVDEVLQLLIGEGPEIGDVSMWSGRLRSGVAHLTCLGGRTGVTHGFFPVQALDLGFRLSVYRSTGRIRGRSRTAERSSAAPRDVRLLDVTASR